MGAVELATRQPVEGVILPVGETAEVMLREDGEAAYPIVKGVPVLLGPEALAPPARRVSFDLTTGRYAEAYSEAAFYNSVALAEADTLRASGSVAGIESESMQHLLSLSKLPAEDVATFPRPIERWLSARMDLGSETDCFLHIGAVVGRSVLVIGGKGITSILFLIAGAKTCELVTPMIGEAVFAMELAKVFGLAERFRCVIGIAEELPFADNCFDAAFSGGCVHHMTTELAFPEIARVLKPGGKFAAVEPWRAPLYGIGTRVLGKREPNPFCRPLDNHRVAPLASSFSSAEWVQHGTLTRYPMLALEKLGARIPAQVAMTVGNIDDRLCTCIAGLRRLGSGVALLATK